jgi:AraC family transcriptional regulator
MTALKEAEGRFSAASEACEFALPRRKLLCSLAAGWTSLLVQRFESPGTVEAFETRPTPDQLIVVVTGGCRDVECFSDGRWRKAVYRPGSVSLTTCGHADRLRWRSLTPVPAESLHLYIPQHFFSSVREEYQRAGAPARAHPLNSLSFSDQVISQVALSVADAIQNGAPDLYAQSAAQFLAAHLLSAQSGWPDPSQDKRSPGKLSNRRLAHVLEYMNAYYAEPLSLDQLAREACVSRFHFGRLFKELVGVTPHRYLVKVRLDAAASLLNDTDLSVLDIAISCGYGSAAHFTAAFHRRFFQTPSSYRGNLRGAASEQTIQASHCT